MNVSVVIRCFNRIEDLTVSIGLIKRFTAHRYDIIVAFNGHLKGYSLSDDIVKSVSDVVHVGNNDSHTSGSAALLMESIPRIKPGTDYVILLEADTWMLDEALVTKYIDLLAASDAVWASSKWNDRLPTLGVDFAVCKYAFLKDNIAMFDFKLMAEEYACCYLIDRGYRYIIMDEFHPVTMTRLLHPFFHNKDRRIKDFPRARVVAYHIEDLKGGMIEKKRRANICAGRNIFPEAAFGEQELVRRNRSLHRYHRTIGWYNDMFFWYKRKRRIPMTGAHT
ncbi:MAG: glycosyltransferase [Spirochaetota bacterium]